MSGLIAATQPAQRIVVERGATLVVERGGGTPWWVPLAIALGVALVAAFVSYAVTWRFKRADVDRENALRAVDIVDRAEQIASLDDLWNNEGGGGMATYRLLQEARVRAQPLDDNDLDQRFRVALSYNVELVGWDEKTSAARDWLAGAISDIREALVPHLAAPNFIRRNREVLREFPTQEELNAMPSDRYGRKGQPRIDALVQWKADRGERG
jgi:hypothetical protein